MGYFRRVSELTPTRLWVNNVTREQARKGIEAGAVGCTQNPSYVSKMLQFDPDLCRSLFDKWIETEDDDNEVLIQVRPTGRPYCRRVFACEESCVAGYVTIRAIPLINNESILRR